MSDSIAADLAHAARLAALAPSSHNCQPWGLATFETRQARGRLDEFLRAAGAASVALPRPHETGLMLAVDGSRALRALEGHTLEMNVSCGMYLHVLCTALAARGWTLRVPWCAASPLAPLPARGWPQHWVPLAALAVARSGAAPRPDAVERLLRSRVTNRARYGPEPLPGELLDRLRAPASPLPALAHVDAEPPPAPELVTAPEEVSAVGAFVARHAGRDFSDAAAWAETYAFIRFRDHELRTMEDGFPVTQLFGPLSPLRRAMWRLALAPRAMSLLGRLGMPALLGRALGELVGQGPALACFSFATEHPSVAAQLAGGGAVMDFWLRATAAGLALHPVSVVLQHTDLRRALQRERRSTGRLFFLSRLGRPAVSFPPAPRRSDPLAAVVRT